MSDAIRYLCVARLDGIERVFFWESEGREPDHVVLDDLGLAPAFPSEVAARQAASVANQAVSSESPSVYDLDSIQAWCKSNDDVRDCGELLKAWNLFGDLPRGESLFAAADMRATPIYDKLFRGSNLPAMTPAGEHYVPTWSASETAALKQLLLLGVAELRARLR